MHLQIAVDIFRDLPYLAVNGIIVFWYLYQVIAGTRRFIRKRNDISGSQITTRVIHFICNQFSFGNYPALRAVRLCSMPVISGSIYSGTA